MTGLAGGVREGPNIAKYGPRFWLLSPLEAPKWVQDPGNGLKSIRGSWGDHLGAFGAKNSTAKANLLEDENRRMEEENMALKKLNTAMKEGGDQDDEGGEQEDRGREVGREEVEQRHERGD